MTALTRSVRAYPIATFAVLACMFGWLPYLLAGFGVGSHPGNMPLGPVAAAAVVTGCQGRQALRAWADRLRRWAASPGWYAVAVLVPIAIHVGNVLVNHGLGAPLPTPAQLAGWTDVPVAFAFMLLFVGIGEEAGWTAFAAPRLISRYGLLGAWAVLAPIRIVWHLPLMLTGDMPWLMGIVGNAAFQLTLLVVLALSGGRWTLAAVWHATLNAVGGAFLFTMVTGADRDRLGLLLALAYAALSVALLPWVLTTSDTRPARPTQPSTPVTSDSAITS